MGRGYYVQIKELLLAHDYKLIQQGKGCHEIWKTLIAGDHSPCL